MQSLTIGFIGLGLIGGSIARAIKNTLKESRLIAYSHHDEIDESLLSAKENKILDVISTDLSLDFRLCDIIFLCAPVMENIRYLERLCPIIKPDCLITDVGSVKSGIMKASKELHLDKNFIGGHPMAGSEKTGYINSSVHLLENAYYILTPTPDTPASLLDKLLGMIKIFHAIPITLDQELHDDFVAAISHIPHIIASALMHLVEEHSDESGQMLSLAAGGFKDITRIASSSPTMWQNICLTNRDSILKFLGFYEDSLQTIGSAIAEKDEEALYEYFDSAKNYRDAIPNRQNGMLDRTFELYLDIIDEAGAIASLATLLASNGISIKNIGILHNREFQEGVLRIELYDQTSCEKASQLFKKHHYTLCER
ncbi:MAG: prephenate dehydrogenase [Acetivibrio sp.]